MNVTVAIDEETVERARRLAEQRGTSLNQMIRDYLAEVTSHEDTEQALEEIERLWAEDSGDSRGWKWNRDELHDRRVLR